MITILITGAGAPGTLGTIQMLKHQPKEPKVRIITTDMREEVAGKYYSDKFYQIPPCDSLDYISALYDVCEKENVDLIIPQNTMELQKLSAYQWAGMKFMVERAPTIFIANNKFTLIKKALELDVPVPSTVNFTTDTERGTNENLSKFFSIADTLGYDYNTDTPIVVKPAVGHGSRGVKIIHGHIDYAERWNMKPDSTHMAAEDFMSWFSTMPTTDMLIQEYLPGQEYTVDVMIGDHGHMAVPRRRDEIKSGITSLGTVVEYEELSEYCLKLSHSLGMKYPHGYQFKEDADGTPKLLECNPRVQGTMIATHYAGWNIVWDGVRAALDQEEVDLSEVKINWGTRVLRYTDTIAI